MRVFVAISIVAFLALLGFLTFEVISPSLKAEEKTDFVCGNTDADFTPKRNSKNPNGLRLFKMNCARCHSLNFNISSTGPALSGVSERLPGKDWLKEFLRNPKGLFVADDYAMALKAEYNAGHPPFEYLTDEEIADLVDFVYE